MSRKEDIERKTEELVEPIVTGFGCQLVDVEYVKEVGDWYLRIYADKEGGITIEDCEQISRAFSVVLDEKDYIEDAYIMEVSSPGLLRPLKKDKDFDRYIGKPVEVNTFKPYDGSKELVGWLVSYTKEEIVLDFSDEYDENSKENQISVVRKDISLIRPYIEF